jgi:hypothetical protein
MMDDIVNVLYVLYFGPLIFVLAEYAKYTTAAPAVVVGVTAAHFVAGFLSTKDDLRNGVLNRYLKSKEKWLNIIADLLVTVALVIAAVALAAQDAADGKRLTLVSAILAVGGNIFCIAGRLSAKSI